MKLLVTGSTGFVGSNLTKYLSHLGHDLVLPVRKRSSILSSQHIFMPDINSSSDWSDALVNVDVVIHCAARVDSSHKSVSDVSDFFRISNVDGTLNLARQAFNSGVKRFIFLSSIKVNGEVSSLDHPFTSEMQPMPSSPYAKSKYDAEVGLLQLANDTGLEVVIIRPPLIYGPGVKGNFAGIVKLINTGLPLPLGSVLNKRSLLCIDNLVDLIAVCISHPAAVNQIFLASDGKDLSTSELIGYVAKAMNKPSRLISVPQSILMLFAKIFGKKAVAQRVLGSLQVDFTLSREILGWEPPIALEEGLRRCFKNK